jgi:hypothetical protein
VKKNDTSKIYFGFKRQEKVSMVEGKMTSRTEQPRNFFKKTDPAILYGDNKSS